mmetsp:Transcript_31415/g.61226  ORF Transcript_31415/g.61226 Transcript_31415/m.61226 type:complete len:236 (+) Transcript_31415:31-738(+)
MDQFAVSWGLDAGVVRGLCVGAACGFSLNRIAKAVGPDDIVMRYPRWVWLTGSFVQFVVYPLLYYLAWSGKDFSLGWLQGTWTDYLQPGGGGMDYEYMLIYALFGYMVKDVASMKSDRLFLVHHIVSIVLALVILYLPAGVGLSLSGLVILEVGTAFYGLKCQYPQSKVFLWLYLVMMTLSNLVVEVLIVWFYFLAPPSAYFKVLYAVFGTGLIYGRQAEVAKDFWFARRQSKAE